MLMSCSYLIFENKLLSVTLNNCYLRTSYTLSRILNRIAEMDKTVYDVGHRSYSGYIDLEQLSKGKIKSKSEITQEIEEIFEDILVEFLPDFSQIDPLDLEEIFIDIEDCFNIKVPLQKNITELVDYIHNHYQVTYLGQYLIDEMLSDNKATLEDITSIAESLNLSVSIKLIPKEVKNV